MTVMVMRQEKSGQTWGITGGSIPRGWWSMSTETLGLWLKQQGERGGCPLRKTWYWVQTETSLIEVVTNLLYMRLQFSRRYRLDKDVGDFNMRWEMMISEGRMGSGKVKREMLNIMSIILGLDFIQFPTTIWISVCKLV